jgi:toxin ParE1/3/4
MTYTVILGDQAREDLRDIYEYIAFALVEPGIALKLRNRIVDGLNSLSEMPERYQLYQEEPWKSQGLRRINIRKYSGFYLIQENIVLVIRILYSGRDISTILKSSVPYE